MRIKSKSNELVPNQPGMVTIILDTPEDLWHLYNIISRGDLIKMKTFRKVIHENSNGTKTTSKKFIPVTIKIQDIEYDQESIEIRVNGKNVSESDYISKGQFQSLTILRGIQFSVIKKSWDEFHIEKLDIASNPNLTSDLAAVLMEEGICHVYLVSSHITTLKAKIEQSIPKKRKGASKHDQSLVKFFNKVLDAVMKSVNFSIIKCIIVGSPGFLKEQFGNFLEDKVNSGDKNYDLLKKNLNKFIYAHTSCGYKQALNELFAKPEVLSQIKNTKASEDIQIMSKYDQVLGKEYDRVIFGMKSVEIAIEKGAIQVLLVSDDYLRKIGPIKRKDLTAKMKKVEQNGNTVKILSSMHPTGESNSF